MPQQPSDLPRRLKKVEQQIANLVSYAALHLSREAEPDIAEGERLLAKAQEVLVRMATPEDNRTNGKGFRLERGANNRFHGAMTLGILGTIKA